MKKAVGFIERVLAWLGVESEESASAERPGGPAPGVPLREPGELPSRSRARIVSLPTAAGSAGTTPAGAAGRGPARVVVFEPRTFDDVESVAAHLREQRPVVLRLKATDRETARRIVDFLSGTIYALDGVMRRIDDDIFLCAPNGVDVQLEGLSGE